MANGHDEGRWAPGVPEHATARHLPNGLPASVQRGAASVTRTLPSASVQRLAPSERDVSIRRTLDSRGFAMPPEASDGHPRYCGCWGLRS